MKIPIIQIDAYTDEKLNNTIIKKMEKAGYKLMIKPNKEMYTLLFIDKNLK